MKSPYFLAALRLMVVSLGVSAFAGIALADPAVKVAQEGSRVEVRWPASPTETGVAVFSLDEAKPLIESLGLAPQTGTVKVAMRALNPVAVLTVGIRDAKNPQGWGAFFDKVPQRPHESFLLALGTRRVQITAQETRTTVSLAEVAGGGFRGDVRFTFYRNTPLIHVETVVTTDEDWRAIIYDAGLASAAPGWESIAWNAPDGTYRSVPRGREGDAETVAAVGRAIVAGSSAGALAAFPPPHQFFYPQDEAYNMHFAWHGRNFRQRVPGSGFGICQSDTGDQRFVPWFNAPPRTEQHLGVFYLLTTGDAPQALDAVARYTHGDRFRKLPGYLTFTSHYHIEHSRAFTEAQDAQQTTGVPRGLEEPGFVKTFKARGVDIVHLAEFHYGNATRFPLPCDSET